MPYRTIRLRDDQIDMIVYELNQSIMGDNDSYDKKLKTIIKKLEEEKCK